MIKKQECSSRKVHHERRVLAQDALKRWLKKKRPDNPDHFHVYRCKECGRFVIGKIPKRFVNTLIKLPRERRIAELIAKPDRDNSENGTLGSLLAEWAQENNLPLRIRQQHQKGRALEHLLELWRLHGRTR